MSPCASRNLLQRIVRAVSNASDVVLNPVVDQGHRKGRLVELNKQLPRRLQLEGKRPRETVLVVGRIATNKKNLILSRVKCGIFVSAM